MTAVATTSPTYENSHQLQPDLDLYPQISELSVFSSFSNCSLEVRRM